jgi:lipoprotein-releasing system permease protein
MIMIVSVATGKMVYKKKLEIKYLRSMGIIISNFDSNQSDATLVPISKKQSFIQSSHRSKCKSYSSNCSKAGIIRTDALRVLFLRALVPIINGITSKSISAGVLPTSFKKINRMF